MFRNDVFYKYINHLINIYFALPDEEDWPKNKQKKSCEQSQPVQHIQLFLKTVRDCYNMHAKVIIITFLPDEEKGP